MPRTYDAQYQQLSSKTNQRLLANGIRLSATSLELFFHCRFHYLLSALLKMEPYEPSLPAAIGNAVHKHLEDVFAYRKPQRVALEPLPDHSQERLSVYELAITARMEAVVTRLHQHLSQSQFVDMSQESTWSRTMPNHPQFSLTGKIDRIMVYRDELSDYVVVIDYKTGSKKFDPIAFSRGTDVQLIVYLDLVRQGFAADRLKLTGFFYQPIPLGRLKREARANPLDQAMKMNGFIRHDERLAKAFDGGGFVSGLKFKKEGGFHALAKTFDEASLNASFATLEILLSSAIEKIEAAQYQITPLPLEKNQRVSQSCEYCPFQGVLLFGQQGQRDRK
ncbi:MAG: PD-(D/E)XK nuclease family protein [Bacillus subtilis]|nr:PD-(D/E)XK nuclease family protein [Bacillus subtilis]